METSLRDLVLRRAQSRCEYCRIAQEVDPLPFQIDHVIARQHDGPTAAGRGSMPLRFGGCCGCSFCNKHKGSDLTSIDPESGNIVRLFNPRSDRWAEYFRIENDEIRPQSAIGRVTVRLLQMNTSERCLERRLLLRTGVIEFPSR
jgi:hypothetical protein